VTLLERFGAVLQKWALGSSTPPTLVHGDFRPDNFLFGREPGAPPLAVVDWQTVSKGRGATDVAYFIGGAFAPDARHEVERDLVETYRRRLTAGGLTYSPEDCWTDYRWGSLHGVLITVLATSMAAQTERGDRLFTLMANRHALHAIELEAVELVANGS
jgi:aminoglycoside phosphotransferase (APT) family kinase protein